MPTTHRTILVKDKSINEVMDVSRGYLQSNGFKIKGFGNELTCTRGTGFLTAQQRFILNFSQQDDQTVRIDGEFFTLAYYFMKSTLEEKAMAGGIPRRKGYKLMEEYIASVGGQVV